MEISLRQLRHYIALAEEKSFAKAAERVHVSQPALSRSIQTLEADLGVSLVDRSARGLTLTPAGRRILERARKVIFESRCLERDADLLKAHTLGEVSFGIGPLPAAICLPQVLTRLSNERPGLQVKVDVDGWTALWEKLYKETIDFLVLDRRGIPVSDEVRLQKCTPHAGGWYVRPTHPLRQKAGLTITDLHAYPFAFAPLTERMRILVRKKLQIAPGQKVNCVAECNDFLALKNLAMNSDVILFATDSAVAQETRSGALSKLIIAGAPSIGVEIAIAYLARRSLSPGVEIAIRMISEVLEQTKSHKRLQPTAAT